MLFLCQCTFIPASYKHQQFWDDFSDRRYPVENEDLVEYKSSKANSLPQGDSYSSVNYYDLAEDIVSDFAAISGAKPEAVAQATSHGLQNMPSTIFTPEKVNGIKLQIITISGFSI